MSAREKRDAVNEAQALLKDLKKELDDFTFQHRPNTSQEHRGDAIIIQIHKLIIWLYKD